MRAIIADEAAGVCAVSDHDEQRDHRPQLRLLPSQQGEVGGQCPGGGDTAGAVGSDKRLLFSVGESKVGILETDRAEGVVFDEPGGAPSIGPGDGVPSLTRGKVSIARWPTTLRGSQSTRPSALRHARPCVRR